MTQAQPTSPHTQALLRSSLVWDNHGCMPLRADASFLPQLQRYRDAGVDVVSLNVGFADISWIEHVRVLSFMRHWISQRPESYSLVSNVEDISRCKSSGKLGIVFDIEGTAADYVKVISIQQLDARALAKLAPAITTLARAEGLEAHARSVEVRLGN